MQHEKTKPEKKQYDWELIEKDVRAGVNSIREISRVHGCPESSIRAKINDYGWERSLGDRVRDRAQEKLLRKGLRKSNATDEEIVEEKADEVASVLLSHRSDIAKMKAVEQRILTELDGTPTKVWIGQFQGCVIEHVVAIAVTERAAALNNLANVQHKRIALERQAYGLADKSQLSDDPITGITVIGICPGGADV